MASVSKRSTPERLTKQEELSEPKAQHTKKQSPSRKNGVTENGVTKKWGYVVVFVIGRGAAISRGLKFNDFAGRSMR
tara:strand:+ start:20844 stop:21074 length:231 start_codon:yes stop_codon:yes gene_type:complete